MNATVVCPHCGQSNRIPTDRTLSKANCGKCGHSLLDTTPHAISADIFEKQIANSDIPVVVDFYADWCGPCKMMAPAFAQAAQNFPLKARFIKIDTEAQQSIAARYGIRSIPTIIVFKNGRAVDQMAGAQNVGALVQWVERFV